MSYQNASIVIDQHAIIQFRDPELLTLVTAAGSLDPTAALSNDCNNLQCHNEICVKIEEVVAQARKQLQNCWPSQP